MNWRGKPLRSYRTIVQLIAATTTDTGLKVRAELDERKYPKGLKVSDTQLAVRFITSSNLVGCKIGKSAGFSPLRIRPA
jgi:hypothetical protein